MNLEIIKIASDTSNNKILKNYTHIVKKKNSICGDEIEIRLNIKKNIIKDFAYQNRSCVFCEASASLLSEKSKNKDIFYVHEFLKFSDNLFNNERIKILKYLKNFKKIFNKKNSSRKECLLLPIRALTKLFEEIDA